MFARTAVTLFALLGLAISVVDAAKSAPLPDDDPFYAPPAGFESASLGAVLKNRTIASPAIGVSGVQILYRTSKVKSTDADATVATILYTKNSNRSQLVVYQLPEDAAWNGCAPSYAFNSGSGGAYVTIVQSGLDKGWTVVIPDYEGIKSAFGAGRLGGHQVLDSFRAALNFKPLGIPPNAALGGYGFSGGAIGSGWAASLQKTYAPELKITGWAFGAIPANLTSTLINVSNTTFGGLGFAGTVGLIAAYPQFSVVVDRYATAAGKAAINKTAHQCLVDDLLDYGGKSVLSYEYSTLGPNFLYLPEVASVLKENTMGVVASEVPVSPVFMYHSKTDEVLPYMDTLKSFNGWCTLGSAKTTNIQFVTLTGGVGHAGSFTAYTTPPVNWLNDRLKGTPLPKTGCFQTSTLVIGLPLAQQPKTVGWPLPRP